MELRGGAEPVMAKTIQKSIKEMDRRNFTEISRLGKERLFSGKFSQTLEIAPVFNENFKMQK